eukprot:6174289-Pleurochrysis_carterae.AAC.1
MSLDVSSTRGSREILLSRFHRLVRDQLVLLARLHRIEKLGNSLIYKLLQLANEHLAVASREHAGQPVDVGVLKHPVGLVWMRLRVLLVCRERCVSHRVDVANLGVLDNLFHFFVRPSEPLFAKVLVRPHQDFPPYCARVLHPPLCNLQFLLAQRYHAIVRAVPLLAVDEDCNAAAALFVGWLQHSLHHTRLGQKINRVLIGIEAPRHHHEDGSGVLHAVVRLLLADGVWIRSARKVHKAVTALENCSWKENLRRYIKSRAPSWRGSELGNEKHCIVFGESNVQI